jgi:hypothetical protein
MNYLLKLFSSKPKILKYSEYKIKQGLWLQIEYRNRTWTGANKEQYSIFNYIDYLEIVGFKDKEVIKKMKGYSDRIATWFDYEREKFDKNVSENINKLMDELLSNN